jgi:tripartite-type tricarboxylate transporter receptor subunit TctC
LHERNKLNKQNGIDIVRVPFGGNEMVNAVMGGTTPIVFLGLANMIGQIKSGQFVGLALNSTERSALFPDIPTLKEATGEDYHHHGSGCLARRARRFQSLKGSTPS